MKIAVIGAGIAGLLTTKYAKSFGFDVVCYEQSDQIGGTWVYREETGVHSSMYKNLRTNFPYQFMGFYDYDFPDSQETSYPTGNEVLTFLKSYATHFKLFENIKLNQQIINIKPIESSDDDRWLVQGKNLHREVFQEEFDAVFVCNGHYSEPKVPEVRGIEYFRGNTMHSHDYRAPEKFRGNVVLVFGGGASAIDIAIEISKTARKVVLSHHLTYEIQDLPKNIEERPDLCAVLSDGSVQFKDESTCEVDSIMFCTGYYYNFPFLSEECHITVDNNHISPLYKHMINIYHPTMFFIGVPFQTLIATLFELQVKYCFRLLMNPETRLSRAEMLKDTEMEVALRKADGLPKNKMHFLGIDRFMPYFMYLQDFLDEDFGNNILQLTPAHLILAKASFGRLKSTPNTFRNYKYRIENDEMIEELIEPEKNKL